MGATEIELYLDFACPWSYIGLIRLQDAADRNASRINIKPVSVKDLLATENPEISEFFLSPNPAKARWQLEDLRLWSEMWGIGLKIHEKWPFDSKICAVAWLLASREAPPIAVALDLFRAHFVEGRDTRRPDVLTDIAVAHGLDPEVFAAGLADESVHERVAGYTQELIRRGGFGTPSMFLGDELFFGNDRVALLEWRLGPISDAEFVAPGQHGPDAA